MRNTVVTYNNKQYLIRFSEKMSNLIEDWLQNQGVDNITFVEMNMEGDGGIIVDYTNAKQKDEDIRRMIETVLVGMGEPFKLQHNI